MSLSSYVAHEPTTPDIKRGVCSHCGRAIFALLVTNFRWTHIHNDHVACVSLADGRTATPEA